MSSANPVRIELASSPPCENFRPRFVQSSDGAAPISQESAIADRAHSASLFALISAAALVGFATNLAMHLLNLRMQHLGFSEFSIGLSVAIQALGIIVAAPTTKYFISSFGLQK